MYAEMLPVFAQAMLRYFSRYLSEIGSLVGFVLVSVGFRVFFKKHHPDHDGWCPLQVIVGIRMAHQQ